MIKNVFLLNFAHELLLSFLSIYTLPTHLGKATISNDGATIINLLDVVHPAAKTLVDIAKSQDAEVLHVHSTDQPPTGATLFYWQK